MKKLTFLTLAVIILFSAHQVSAVSDKANEKATNNPSVEKRNENSHKDTVEAEDVEETTVTPSTTDTDNEEWKNHGQYVKSVAQTHPGGSVVSEAAKSSIGKKVKNPTTSPSVSPSVSVTPTESLTPTETPTETPTPTVTGEPEPTELEALTNQLKELIDALKELISNLNPLD